MYNKIKKILLQFLLLLSTISIYSQQQLKTNYYTSIYSTPFNSWNKNNFEEPIKLLNVKENTLINALKFYLIGDENNYVGDIKVEFNGVTGWMSSINFDTEEVRKIKIINKEEIENERIVSEKKRKKEIEEKKNRDIEEAKQNVIKTKLEPVNNNLSKNNQNVIQMIKNYGGTFTIPCKINNLSLNFIFDTGASDVSISLTEALFMFKNGYLNKDDVIGKEYYSIANGDITEGTTINIKKLEFGNFTLYNVKASISNELKAPLLLGQSALSKLGKIIIDYKLNTLTIIK
jgi:clan AA aspartic protease (TIGR02281 family)